MKVTILGAGAMGSALITPLIDNGNQVNLWGTQYDKKILDAISKGKAHPRTNAEVPNEVNIFYPPDLKEAMEGSQIVVLGVSSKGIIPVVDKMSSLVTEDMILMTVAKGLLSDHGKIMMIQEGVRINVPDEISKSIPMVSVGGPSIASQLAHRVPTKVVYASKDREARKTAKNAFQTPYYQIEDSSDINGLQVCLALKNVYSIALAWPAGQAEQTKEKSMSNTKAILFLQALQEMKKVAQEMGGKIETIMGLAGLGDLVLTSETGRNGRFGKLLGTGLNSTEALEKLNEEGVGVVEGYETADKAFQLVKKLVKNANSKIRQFPLLEEIYQVLYQDKPVKEAIDRVCVG